MYEVKGVFTRRSTKKGHWYSDNSNCRSYSALIGAPGVVHEPVLGVLGCNILNQTPLPPELQNHTRTVSSFTGVNSKCSTQSVSVKHARTLTHTWLVFPKKLKHHPKMSILDTGYASCLGSFRNRTCFPHLTFPMKHKEMNSSYASGCSLVRGFNYLTMGYDYLIYTHAYIHIHTCVHYTYISIYIYIYACIHTGYDHHLWWTSEENPCDKSSEIRWWATAPLWRGLQRPRSVDPERFRLGIEGARQGSLDRTAMYCVSIYLSN